MPAKQERIYVFLDESGKPEVFSIKGINLVEAKQATKFLVLAAISVENQLLIQQKVTEFKSDLLKDPYLAHLFSPAYSLDAFHAQIDYPEIRKRFYRFINLLDINIDVLVIEKLKCDPILQNNPGQFYGVAAGQLLKDLLHQAENAEVIFSRKDSKLRLRHELETEVERARINPIFKLSYQHNPHYTHGGLQIADYVAYAVFQHYETGNDVWYTMIRSKIKSAAPGAIRLNYPIKEV